MKRERWYNVDVEKRVIYWCGIRLGETTLFPDGRYRLEVRAKTFMVTNRTSGAVVFCVTVPLGLGD